MDKYKDRLKRFAYQYGPVIGVTLVVAVKMDRYLLDKAGKVHIPVHVIDAVMGGRTVKLTNGTSVLRLTRFED